MKSKYFYSIISTLTLPVSMVSIISGTNNNTDMVLASSDKQDDSTDYDSVWNESIKDSSEDESIKIFFTRDATLPYQEAILAAEYMIFDNMNGNGSTDDDILFFYAYDLYESNTWDAKDWESKYENVANTNFKFITNTSELGEQYNANYDQYYPSTQVLSDLVSYYTGLDGNNFTFDLWVVDATLEDIYNNDNDTYDFMKHVNKVYVLTDGNYQAYTFINDALNRYNTPGYVQLTQDQIEQKWATYRNDTDDSYKSDYDNYTLYDFINDANIYTFFYTHSYTDSPYYEDKVPSNVTLYKTYPINYNYYDFILKNIADSTQQQTFINDYESFFFFNGKNNITDFFVRNGENYDPNKKNVIWLGDSLILNFDQTYPQKTKEMQSIMQAWLKLFPSDEYNIILSPHPRYTLDWTIELVKWLIQSDDDSNIIYAKFTPWEMFLSWNYKMEQTNGDTYTGLFSPNMENSTDTVFLGYQFTSTTIQTTAFFIADEYNYTLDDIEQTLDPYYFPIPETFDEVVRTSSFSVSPEKQLEINKQEIAKIYQPFVELNAYPDYTKDQVTATDFIRKNYDPNYFIDLGSNNSSQTGLSITDKILIGVLVPVVVIAISVGTYYIIRYNKYKKFRRIKYRKK